MGDPTEEATGRVYAPPQVPRSDTERRPCLLGLSGPDQGRLFLLRPPGVLLGRGPAADLRLRGEGVSRLHARLSLVNSAWVLEDLASTNGTRVGSKWVHRAVLREGDRLQLGGALLRFDWMDPLEVRFHRQMHEVALRDGLTRLFNKRYFMDRLRAEVRHAERQGRPLSLLLIDVDLFKRINDEFGHLVGDRALQAVAATLRSTTRREDLVARCGGEEFAVLGRGLPLVAAERLAERIRRSVAAMRPVAMGQQALTVSIGVAELDRALPADPATSARQLLGAADRALYQAKAAGRNCVRVALAGTC
ncbi:MAG: GGDEF domain-containing protein [Myxococcales bacterium]|nr:diguanylate cyclase [Myxococcota bacterium]MDW8283306.1 GGDEF domain-containing protein [Myxococcales bacterium]